MEDSMYLYAILYPSTQGNFVMGSVVNKLGDLNLIGTKGRYLAMLGFADVRQDHVHLLDVREILYGGRLGGRPMVAFSIVNGRRN